jgi:hypothetical protein
MATRPSGEASREGPPFSSAFRGFQYVAAPCQALCFLSQFQLVTLETVNFSGPCRNAVATFVLRAFQPTFGAKRRPIEAGSTSTGGLFRANGGYRSARTRTLGTLPSDGLKPEVQTPSTAQSSTEPHPKSTLNLCSRSSGLPPALGIEVRFPSVDVGSPERDRLGDVVDYLPVVGVALPERQLEADLVIDAATFSDSGD